MIEQLTEAERRQVFLASLFYLREQRTTSDHEVIGCGERRDSVIKLAKRVLPRFEGVSNSFHSDRLTARFSVRRSSVEAVCCPQTL